MKKIYFALALTLVSMGVLAKTEFPTAMLERPFTMPKNAFESGLQFKNTAVGIMSFDYGITHDFQAGVSWGGLTTDDQGLQPEMNMAVNLGYFLFSTRYASSMANFTLPFHFENDVLKKASFSFTTSIPLIRGHLALLAFYDDLIALDWTNGLKANFNFPLRLNWQATPHLYLKLATNLVNFSTTGVHTHIIDKTPLTFSALYAVTKSVDLVGSFGFTNVQDCKDAVLMLGMAFRGGELDG